jgi:membrane protein implicated in regulation of membrane protease activity
MATKSLHYLKVSKKIIQFLFIFVGFILLGSEQLHGRFYLLFSILGAAMMIFGIFGIKEKVKKTL